MALTFLAGVADARIFRNDELFATAKTLVDSSISIGVSAEDIRAGKGAKLYGKYFHTSTFDLKMTDAMFKLEYIAANVGGELQIGGDVFKTVEVSGNEIATKKFEDAVEMVAGSGTIYVYARKSTDTEFSTYTLKADKTINGIEADTGATYCVEYLYTNENARKLVVKANFTPDTVSVYLDANLYSGDDKNPSTGTKIGTITIKVPRFLLNGTQEISMSMTGAANTPFEGSALAANATGCDGEGIYAEIIEVVDGYSWTEDVTHIFVENQNDLKAGDALVAYAATKTAVKRLKLVNGTGYEVVAKYGSAAASLADETLTADYAVKTGFYKISLKIGDKTIDGDSFEVK